MAKARRQADMLAVRIGADIETARVGLAASIEAVARRASVSSSTVVRVINGDGGVHLDTLCAVATAVGLRISVKAFPAESPSLRDTGQLTIAQYLIAQAHSSLRAALEVPVGEPFGRAIDLVFYSATEIKINEIERRLSDLQAPKRAAMLKRDALQARHDRPVRLVLVVEDTRRNRALVEPHAALVRADLPATSAEILRALRTGTDLGRDGLLWVRPWRRIASGESPTDESRE